MVASHVLELVLLQEAVEYKCSCSGHNCTVSFTAWQWHVPRFINKERTWVSSVLNCRQGSSDSSQPSIIHMLPKYLPNHAAQLIPHKLICFNTFRDLQACKFSQMLPNAQNALKPPLPICSPNMPKLRKFSQIPSMLSKCCQQLFEYSNTP